MTPAVPLAEPFDSPGMAVLDAARIALFTAGLFLAAFQIRPFRESETRGQRARFASVAVLLLIVAGSRVQNLGEPFAWQFGASLIGFGLLAYGTRQWRHEIPGQPRRDDPPPGRHGTA